MSHTADLTRRAWLAQVTNTVAGRLAVVSLLPALLGAAHTSVAVIVYKDPSCGCCTKWVEHLRTNGYAVESRDRSDMDALKDSLGVPATLRSCHTAVVGKYVLEGHVPAKDLKKLLAQSPKQVLGLAVPGMPSGSPGMETSGTPDRYRVIAFAPNGRTHVFAQH